MTLNAVEVEQFHKDGYVFPLDVLSAGEVANIRGQVEAEEAKHGGKLLPGQRSKGHLLFKWLDNLIRDPRVLDPVEQLIGPNILCWNTLFWIKEADHKSFVGWHQDTRYWGLSHEHQENVLSVWYALDDSNVQNGCMRVVPRTHPCARKES